MGKKVENVSETSEKVGFDENYYDGFKTSFNAFKTTPKREVFCQWKNEPKPHSRKVEGKSVVDKAGFIPFNEQIKSMRAAGTRLEEFRRATYTNEYDEMMKDDFRINPMGYKHFDEFAAHDLSRSLTIRKIVADKARREYEENRKKAEQRQEADQQQDSKSDSTDKESKSS